MAWYSEKTLKELFALSMNVCAFRVDGEKTCEERLVDPAWHSVKARICHIRARKPRGPRFDSSMTEKERYAFDNLILLCPTHHVRIDDLEPERFTVEVLTEMKWAAIEAAKSGNTWTIGNDALIERAVVRLIAEMEREYSLPPLPPMPVPANLEGSAHGIATVTGQASVEFGGLTVVADGSTSDDSASASGLQGTFTASMGGPNEEVTIVGGPGASVEHEVTRGTNDELNISDSATSGRHASDESLNEDSA